MKKGLTRPPGAKMGIIEAVWKPEEEAKGAPAGTPAEVEGATTVLAQEEEGVKVVPAGEEAVEAMPAAGEDVKADEAKPGET